MTAALELPHWMWTSLEYLKTIQMVFNALNLACSQGYGPETMTLSIDGNKDYVYMLFVKNYSGSP